MELRRVIFVSAVSNEFHKVPPELRHIFQSYRDIVKQAFRILAPHYEVIIQENLPQGYPKSPSPIRKDFGGFTQAELSTK